MSRAILLLFLAAAVAGPLAADAADDAQPKNSGKGPAYTAPPKDDPNYPLLGEFLGEISTGADAKEMLGLQIRPVGNDNFDAMSFTGGLPGQDKHNPQPLRLIGRRSGDLVILSGGPWAIFVGPDACTLIDREGNKIGRLERLQRTSPTMHAKPPQGALVLFDGTNLDQFTVADMTEDGLLMQGADIKPMFQDFNLHAEFLLPYMPQASGQSRGNSGFYLQSRYECQVLDSFAQEPVINGLGALYQMRKPDINMCLPPLVWQTYDIQFTAPRWAADGSKLRDAHITSWVNGVKVQDNIALPSKTGAGKPEEPVLLPTKIQDHGDPVRFRNIWVVDRGLASSEFPVFPTKEELDAIAKAEQQRQAAQEAALKAKQEAEAKAKQEAEAKAKREAAKNKESKPADAGKPKPPAEQEESGQPKQGDADKPAADQPAPQEAAGSDPKSS